LLRCHRPVTGPGVFAEELPGPAAVGRAVDPSVGDDDLGGPGWEGVAADPASSPAGRAIADAVNRLHRIVISSRPAALPWRNAELVVVRSDDELAAAVARFRDQPGGDLGVPGGVRTAQRFARLGLIDEYVLHVHPVAIGAGKPLFTRKTSLKLVSAKTYDSGVMRLRYQPAQPGLN
jgi:dihydrofolate reductase